MQKTRKEGLHTISDNNTIPPLNRLVRHRSRKVIRQQYRVPLRSAWVEGRFEEETCVVEALVGEAFGVEAAHGFDYGACEGGACAGGCGGHGCEEAAGEVHAGVCAVRVRWFVGWCFGQVDSFVLRVVF